MRVPPSQLYCFWGNAREIRGHLMELSARLSLLSYLVTLKANPCSPSYLYYMAFC